MLNSAFAKNISLSLYRKKRTECSNKVKTDRNGVWENFNIYQIFSNICHFSQLKYDKKICDWKNFNKNAFKHSLNFKLITIYVHTVFFAIYVCIYVKYTCAHLVWKINKTIYIYLKTHIRSRNTYTNG